MVSITSNVAMVVLIIIVIAAIAAAWFVDPKCFETSRFRTLLIVLAGLGVIIIYLFYMGVLQIQSSQQELAIVQEQSTVQKSLVNDVLNSMMLTADSSPEFNDSITPLLDCKKSKSSKACVDTYVLSSYIFVSWNEVIVTDKIVNYEPQSYLYRFLQQANSKLLYEQWKNIKYAFNKKMRIFGDLLFEYGLSITDQRPISYLVAARKIIDLPVFDWIMS